MSVDCILLQPSTLHLRLPKVVRYKQCARYLMKRPSHKEAILVCREHSRELDPSLGEGHGQFIETYRG